MKFDVLKTTTDELKSSKRYTIIKVQLKNVPEQCENDVAIKYLTDLTYNESQLVMKYTGKYVTKYNNKTYRIDDDEFGSNSISTFRTKYREITYMEYYKEQYDIEIRDLKQPLLDHRMERRVVGETQLHCLIPEICYLTGLIDEMRADFEVNFS